MKYVYLVQGQTGEYSDHIEWIYKAFLREDEAYDIVSYLNDWLVGNNCYMSHYTNSIKHWDMEGKMRSEIDPKAFLDYTGAKYSIFKVEVME